MKRIIYSKYSNDRNEKYCIRTDICIDEQGQKSVRKVPSGLPSVAHVQSLVEWYKTLSDMYKDTKITVNQCTKSDEGVELAYVEGISLEDLLDSYVEKGDQKAFYETLDMYIEILRQVHTKETFTETEAFRDVFGNAYKLTGLPCAAVSNVDVVCSNILINDTWNMIDYEWSFGFCIPMEFLIYRVIHYYLYSNSKRFPLQEWNLFARYQISEERIGIYNQMEEHLQSYIADGHVAMRRIYEDITPGYGYIFNELEEQRSTVVHLQNLLGQKISQLEQKEQEVAQKEHMISTMQNTKVWKVYRKYRKLFDK